MGELQKKTSFYLGATMEISMPTEDMDGFLILDAARKELITNPRNGSREKREFTGRKVRGSNPTSASQILAAPRASSFFWVAWQLGTGKIQQVNIFYGFTSPFNK
ncbi:hypothetical protein CSKR_107529 [Clonorchis sinensis]|uniref:Uncharacterized protein n=1 Tax=Clonorchis sinensis TaxID=79923 RepID=A0A419Q7K7_CLOSI|nr:hypothetical protein CSKR_107529 [Clonorchis sinensis]